MNNKGIKCGFPDMIEQIVELMTPNNCFICNSTQSLLCDACIHTEIDESFPVCYSCSKRSDYYLTCSKCRKSGPKPTALYHVANYDGNAKQLIHKMKFSATREAARIIGKQMDEVVPNLQIDAVIPIPTATRRIRQRGYDHALLIAKELAKTRGWQLQQLLKRTDQSRQLGATKKARQLQAEQSFVFKPTTNVPRTVLLIDDVVSSGASIEAATRLFRKVGVKKVYAAVYARKL